MSIIREEIEESLQFEGEDDEREVIEHTGNDSRLFEQGNSTYLKAEVDKLVKEKFDTLRLDESALGQDGIAKSLKDSIKLKIVNKGANFKCDYKLNNSMKFDLFYDYFSSELRSNGFLHVVDKEITSNVTDAKLIEEQCFKVRDILINHLELYYHSEVMHLQKPDEILEKLKEIKRCETNVTSHTVRKQLYSMQYVIGKINAADFCNRFEHTIRNYENSSGAVPLSEEEKRDTFYNAVMVSVPRVQTIDFISKRTKGNRMSYDELKLIVMQDEAEKNQTSNTAGASGGQTQARAANFDKDTLVVIAPIKTWVSNATVAISSEIIRLQIVRMHRRDQTTGEEGASEETQGINIQIIIPEDLVEIIEGE